MYMLRNNGKKRPRYLDAEACLHCGKPKNGAPFVKGMCRPCYQYQRLFSKPRPKRLFESQHGWCECRQPATHTVTVQVHHHIEEMPLCDDCYAIEQMHTAWYGDGKTTGNLQQGKTAQLYGDD